MQCLNMQSIFSTLAVSRFLISTDTREVQLLNIRDILVVQDVFRFLQSIDTASVQFEKKYARLSGFQFWQDESNDAIMKPQFIQGVPWEL